MIQHHSFNIPCHLTFCEAKLVQQTNVSSCTVLKVMVSLTRIKLALGYPLLGIQCVGLRCFLQKSRKTTGKVGMYPFRWIGFLHSHSNSVRMALCDQKLSTVHRTLIGKASSFPPTLHLPSTLPSPSQHCSMHWFFANTSLWLKDRWLNYSFFKKYFPRSKL